MLLNLSLKANLAPTLMVHQKIDEEAKRSERLMATIDKLKREL